MESRDFYRGAVAALNAVQSARFDSNKPINRTVANLKDEYSSHLAAQPSPSPDWALVEEALHGGLDNFDGCEIDPGKYNDCLVANLNSGYVGLFQTIESALALIAAAKAGGR